MGLFDDIPVAAATPQPTGGLFDDIPVAGTPVTQAVAPPRQIPLDPANTPSFSSDVATGLNQTSQALNAQSATAANISIDQINARIAYLEQGQPNHPAEFKMPEQARQQMLTRLMRERDAKTQQFSGSVTALGQDAAAAKSIPVNTGLQQVGQAKTVGEAFSSIGENPWEVTRGMVAQSLPAAIPIIVSTIAAGPLGGLLAGATTGAITGGGNSALKVLNDNQIDTSNPEAVKAALADPAISEQVRRAFAIGAGVDTGVGAVTGAFGGMGFNVGSTPARTIAANAGIQAGGQGTAAIAGEGGKQVALDGKLTAGPLVMQALGQAVFAPVEGARATWAVAKTRTSQKLGRPATDAEVLNDPQAQQTLREAGVTDEQILTAAEAAGITDLNNPADLKRFNILQDRLAKRRIEESLRPAPDNYGADGRPVTSDDWRNTPKGVFSQEVQRRQDERASLGAVEQKTTTQNGVTAQTARATEEGTINPQATNVVPREPDTRPIAVQPDGGAYRADDATMQGRNREQVTREARTLRLPAPGREVLTDAEIALQRAKIEGGNQPTVETPPRLYGQGDGGEIPGVTRGTNANGDYFDVSTPGVGNYRTSSSGTGVYGRTTYDSGKVVHSVMNEKGDMVSGNDINRNKNNTDPESRPYTPRTPEEGRLVAELLAKANSLKVSDAEAKAAKEQAGRIVRGEEAPKPAEPPPYRAPQTSTDMVGQRQAGDAFTLAERQRGRAGDDVRDTQVAGRPEGANPQKVYLDDGFPVEIVSRTMMPDAKGNMVEVATVRRYDPRTGKPEVDAVEYQIPVRQLKSKGYAAEPRMAQDFEVRAETGKINAGRDRGKRMDDAQGLQRQTYRQTAPDPDLNASGRFTRPEQPDGPTPFKKWSNYEEAMRDFTDRQSRGQTEPPKSGPDYSKAKSSNQAGPKDRDGRFVVDENGHVMSSAQGPIRFADQKQAAKWILNVGQKQSPDQIFEIAVHPTGKGFTTRERGRSESPPPGGKAGPEAAAQPETNRPAQPETPPRGLEGPRAEKTPEPPAARQPEAAPTPEQSYADKVRAERERLWDEDMGRAKRTKASNDRAVEATARENVMRQEAAEQIKDAEGMGASKDDITDIAQLYRRKDGQSPQEAWEDAESRWTDKREQEAMRDENLYDQADRDFDPLQVDSNSDAAKMGDIYTQEAQQTAREAQISRDSADNIPFDEVPNGKREADRPADATGRQDAKEQSPERGGTRQEAGAGGKTAGGEYATDAGPDGGRQTVVPGAERDTRGANQRRADAPLRGGDEVPPKGGLFDEDSRNQATFFSNPFMDPAAWKGLAKSLGLHSGYVRHMRAMFDDIKDMRDGGSSKKTWTMTDIGRSIMWSNDGQLGALEKAYKSPTIGRLRDWLHPEADMGRQGTSPKRGYHEATDIRTQDNLNKLGNVLEPFEDNKSAKNQIVRLIQNPGNIKRGTPIHDAAAKIMSMLDDELQYMKAAGVDISEIKSGGYWPRIVDAFLVLQNPEKFLRAASRQYLKDGLAPNRTEADAMALAWLESIEMGGVGMRKEGTDFVMLGGTPNADFKRERVFGPSIEREANNPLREFYVQDPADVLTLHFQRTARRAEWAREMGDDLSKWKLKKDAIVKEGGIAALPQVVDLIANATGISKSYISPHARSAVAVVRSLGVFGTLSLAAASSIAETAMPAIRAGNPARLVGDVGRTIKALAGKMDNERAWAEDLGVIVNALGDSILGRRYHALEAGNKFQQRTMNRYFRMTGLEQLTTAQRVVAAAGAQAYLRRQAINLTGKRSNSAYDFLSELGIAGKDAEGFSKWLFEQADGKPTSASVKDDGAYGTMYRTAIHRFIRQTNMDPNTSTRPAWANDPYKSLMFQLNSYTWAFQKNVLNRAGAGIVKGVTGKGYTMQDRMAFLAPAMMLPVLYAIQYGVGEARDSIFADPTAKPKDEAEKHLRAADRGGAFGQASPLMNFITGVRYERDLASSLAGPALGNLLRPIESWIKTTGDRNSPNTNTRERTLAKDMYRGFVFPVIAGTMAAAAPMGVGALAIQALNTGEAREAATSFVAGPKPVERPQRPKPPQRPQPPRPPRP